MCVHSSPHSLFLSFWLLLLVFSAENAGSPPASAQSILYFKTFFILEYSWLIIFWVSGGQESDSIICIPVSWSQRYPSHPGCHITEWNSPCYTLTHCRLSILNRAVPTARSWRFKLGTLGILLWSALTLFGHSRQVGNIFWFPIPNTQSIALITPSKSPVAQCRAPWDTICMESSAVLPRTKQPSIWLHEFTALGFLKFPPFLKAFFESISQLWTPLGSWHESSTLCWGWVVTVHPLFILASILPTEGWGSLTHKGGTQPELWEDAFKN